MFLLLGTEKNMCIVSKRISLLQENIIVIYLLPVPVTAIIVNSCFMILKVMSSCTILSVPCQI